MKKRPIFFSALLFCLPFQSPCAEIRDRNAQFWELKLDDYRRMVIEGNERVQAQLLATEAARLRSLGERGVFEPELAGSAQGVANRRQNSVQQERELQGVAILDENNSLYDAGIESLVPTGAKIRLGSLLNNLNNNLPPAGVPGLLAPANLPRTNQWQSFSGITVTQPLLRNYGATIAMAGIRLAALNSAAAFQEYRRELMVALAKAEAAYWNLYLAQEQLRFLDESIAVAESILDDSWGKLKAGKGTELDVKEAEAALALRRTKRNESLQLASDATGQLLVQAGVSPETRPILVRVMDVPTGTGAPHSHAESWRTLLQLNPDYTIQKKKLDEAMIRYKVAKNQRLPEFNLKGSYGYNGLANTPDGAWSQLSSGGFPSWSAGVEFRIPLGGGIRSRAEMSAAQLAVDQSKIQLRGLETQLSNAMSAALRNLQTNAASAEDYRTMLTFNESLLKTQQERLLQGKVEGRRVLEVEAGLFEVKQGLAESLVRFERTALELHLAEGSLLKSRHLEFTPTELRDQTLLLLGDRRNSTKRKPVAEKKETPAPTPKPRVTPSRLVLKEPNP